MMEGGILSIISDCLNYLDEHLYQEYNIVALVHNKSFFNTKHIHYIEFKDSKSSWFKRIKYEYFYFKKLSAELKPFLWLSLHDMTPNVVAQVKAVYCHNATPFYKPSLKALQVEPKLIAFSAFYKYLYKIHIRKNDYVIVQQKWLREEFKKIFGIKNIIVAYPAVSAEPNTIRPVLESINQTRSIKQQVVFFYPSFPRVFKNFEAVFEASKLLQQKNYQNFKIIVTLAGNENKYAAHLYKAYKADPFIEWKGLLPRDEIFKIYGAADCLLFPSKLETWGLPITEFRSFDKPIILANLPYAKETTANYSKAKFIDPDSPAALAEAMEELLHNHLKYDSTVTSNQISANLEVTGWKELFNVLLLKNNG